jgi:4-hydroxy-tetrahydrodipicolinate synthase
VSAHSSKTSQPLQRIEGIAPIIPTPFAVSGEVDYTALRRLIDFARASGACAACLPAYASEFYKLNEEERRRVVVEAVHHAAGRLPIIAQVNYPSAPQAADSAQFAQQAGANAVAVAVPRLFSVPERDLFRYFERVLSPVEIPILIQDFNPSGQVVSPRFVAELHRAFPHFRFLKLEEPLMAAKIEAMIVETEGKVGILEGWGGMFMLELIPAGVCGVMPGLAVSDLLGLAFRHATAGRREEAYDVFAAALPQIVYSLQHMEFFHHAEKLLLVERGVIDSAQVRDSTMSVHRLDLEHIHFLNHRILAALDRFGLARNPAA